MGVFKRWLLASAAWAGARVPVDPYLLPIFDDVLKRWGTSTAPKAERWKFALSQAQKNGIWLTGFLQRMVAAGHREIMIPVGVYEIPSADSRRLPTDLVLRWRDETTVRDRRGPRKEWAR